MQLTLAPGSCPLCAKSNQSVGCVPNDVQGQKAFKSKSSIALKITFRLTSPKNAIHAILTNTPLVRAAIGNTIRNMEPTAAT